MNKYIDAKRLKAEIERRLERYDPNYTNAGSELKELLSFITSLQQEQPEVDLEKFTKKIDDWKARYNHPDNIPIKATMAFTARMFYQYPNVARQWYEQLPKATMD